MPLNPVKIALAVQGGLSPVCATCSHYWEGRERNLPGDLCTAPHDCGSPLVGLTFPAYVGPVTDFTEWCFVCGEGASHVIELPQSSRLCAICDTHLQSFSSMRPLNMRDTTPVANALEAVVRSSTGTQRHISAVVYPKKKTLLTLINETEAEWAAARAARGENVDAE